MIAVAVDNDTCSDRYVHVVQVLQRLPNAAGGQAPVWFEHRPWARHTDGLLALYEFGAGHGAQVAAPAQGVQRAACRQTAAEFRKLGVMLCQGISRTRLADDELKALAGEVHPVKNVGASIASGSFPTAGMLVAPCSIRTMAEIATELEIAQVFVDRCITELNESRLTADTPYWKFL